MHRAYDPGDTIRVDSRNRGRIANDLKREMENGVSRSSLVHGTQTNPNSDTWYDTDAFLLDQVKEVLNKLSEGSIDDEIWGKIVIMERCKRVAKAYLRKTTIIIDGSEDEFDGKTLGFNHFENPSRDEHTDEIRAKIADGVILKMDYQGNIKGMARGATPIICQGWKDTRSNCISDRLVRLHGKLNQGASEDEKAYKVFDMKKFKNYLERETHDGTPDARTLLLKTCMRIALVKDGGDMNRTPCWFAIVNLVALDMVKEKIPMIQSLLNGNALSNIPKNIPTSSSDGIDAQTLTQIIAAAVTQANKGNPNNTTNLPISPEQLAQIASTISIAQTNTMRTSDLVSNKKDRKKQYHCSTSSLDSSGEENRRAELSIAKNRAKRWENERGHGNMEKNLFEKNRTNRSNRPLLQDAIFTRSQSITSDYDSNREHFDSGSWSSTQSNYKGGRSTASSIISDQEFSSASRDEMKGITEIKEANSTSDGPVLREARQRDGSLLRPNINSGRAACVSASPICQRAPTSPATKSRWDCAQPLTTSSSASKLAAIRSPQTTNKWSQHARTRSQSIGVGKSDATRIATIQQQPASNPTAAAPATTAIQRIQQQLWKQPQLSAVQSVQSVSRASNSSQSHRIPSMGTMATCQKDTHVIKLTLE